MNVLPTDPTSRPFVDVVTPRAAVLIQDRPIVSMSLSLAATLKRLTASKRSLYLVTPPTTRITALVRYMLPPGSRWVVADPDTGSRYDGLSGAELTWDGEQYVPTVDMHGAPTLSSTFCKDHHDVGRQLILNLYVRHPTTAPKRLGRACTVLAKALTGEPPAGWGPAEPVSHPWHESDLTAFARNRSSDLAWMAVCGGGSRPLTGSIEARRIDEGVQELVTLYVGYGSQESLPIDDLARAADELASDDSIVTMIVEIMRGRRDMTYLPHRHGLPWPAVLVAGNEVIAKVGITGAVAPPDGVVAVCIGKPSAPDVSYPRSQEEHDDSSWYRFVR